MVQVSRCRGGNSEFSVACWGLRRNVLLLTFLFLSTGDTPIAESTFFTGPLRTKMSEDLQLTSKAKRTHDGYLREIRKLADYCRQAPDGISEEQMRRYFLHLKNQRKFAAGSLTVTLSALKFFYRITCPRDWITLEQLKVKGPRTLPEVITIEQVHSIIDACTTERMAVFFWTLYSLGLRLDEGLNLQVGDIDAARGAVHIHRGKGAKDRYLPLPTSTLNLLRQHWMSRGTVRFGHRENRFSRYGRIKHL